MPSRITSRKKLGCERADIISQLCKAFLDGLLVTGAYLVAVRRAVGIHLCRALDKVTHIFENLFFV